jgi:hypothetical protein
MVCVTKSGPDPLFVLASDTYAVHRPALILAWHPSQNQASPRFDAYLGSWTGLVETVRCKREPNPIKKTD